MIKVQRLGDCVTPLKEDNRLANGKVKLSCVYEPKNFGRDKSS